VFVARNLHLTALTPVSSTNTTTAVFLPPQGDGAWRDIFGAELQLVPLRGSARIWAARAVPYGLPLLQAAVARESS